MRAIWLALLVGAMRTALCADEPAPVPFQFGPAEPLTTLNQHFQRTDGWIGGDGCYSVRLDSERLLWLFSDTLVGQVRGGQRHDFTLVNNSAAIQSGPVDQPKFEFYVATTALGVPTAWVRPDMGQGFFWLQAAYQQEQQLFLFLTQVEKTSGEGAFGFRLADQSLGIVTDLASPPDRWQFKQVRVPFVEFTPGLQRAFGTALCIDGEFVYAYGFSMASGGGWGGRGLLIARAPAGALADFSSWRFYDGQHWHENIDSVQPLFLGFATEASVSRLPNSTHFVIVYSESGLSPNILARTAPHAWGPWSPPVQIYHCPDAELDPKVFCYAAKAHAELAQGQELIVSYCTNSNDFGHVARSPGVYLPRFIRVPIR